MIRFVSKCFGELKSVAVLLGKSLFSTQSSFFSHKVTGLKDYVMKLAKIININGQNLMPTTEIMEAKWL